MTARFGIVCLLVLNLIMPNLVSTSAAQSGTNTEDSGPPAPVTTLAATTGEIPGTADLEWFAPGDDGTTGTASGYVVRYNTAPITESNWSTSTDVSGEPIPGPAGSIESITVSGLIPGQVYHFALKTEDEVPNISSVSNSARAAARISENAIYLPGVLASAGAEPPMIPATTKVLPETTTDHLIRISDDGSEFTFGQWTPDLEALDPGDIMVGNVAENARYGFLRRVTSVTEVGGQVVVQTEPTTLEDAIQSGSIKVRGRLTPDQVRTVSALPGVTLAGITQFNEQFYLELEDVVLYDHDGDHGTPNDQIRADGSIRLEPGFDFSLVVTDWELRQLAFTLDAVETAELVIKAEVDLMSVEEEREVARYTLAPITIMIGFLPVVFVPVLSIHVGVDGDVHVGVTVGVEQQATLMAGVRYAGGTWQPVSYLSNQFYYSPPQLSAGLDLKGYTAARLSLLLYGVVGPYSEIETYLDLEADVSQTPWWILYGGIQVPIGVKLEILGHSLADYETDVVGYRVILAQAESNRPPNMPFSPAPNSGSIVQDLDTNLSWSGGDLDGDDVTYDVYLEVGDNTPDVLVSNNQTGLAFDPGILEPTTHYFWRIVAQDEHGATTAGPVWDFITANGDTCPIDLVLQSPQVTNLSVTVDGSVSSDCSTITHLHWQWGDGIGDDQWFPAHHTYALTGTYIITVIAYNDLGDTKVATTTVQVGGNIDGMVSVPAGEFQMGCDPNHNGGYACLDQELPLHPVYLDAYYIDIDEVTNAEYAQCVAPGACTPPASISSWTRPFYYGNPTYADYPVIRVSWQNASDYCTWAGKRLPTEAEWEKAARGAAGPTAFPWGDQSPGCSMANGNWCMGDTTQVGDYPAGASPYGALDMAGNVYEWVADWYQWDYYTISPYNNPPGPPSGTQRVMRGGSFISGWSYLRVALRSSSSPDNTLANLGFRCAADATGP